MSDTVEDMDIPISDCDKYLVEFNKGNYLKCRKILEQMLATDDNKTNDVYKNRTLNDCILRNNVVVCKALELLSQDRTEGFTLLKNEQQQEIQTLNCVPQLCVDANLGFVFNYLSLFFIKNNEGTSFVHFEEQLSTTLRNLCRVLDGGRTKSRLEQIQLAFRLSYTTFEEFDSCQALLLTAIRILIATAAQDEFVLKITLKTKDCISLPMEMLHTDFDRTKQMPILLLPMLHGEATALSDLNVNHVITSLNLVLAVMLVRLRKLKPAILCITTNLNSPKLRALTIYIKAHIQYKSNLKIDAQKLLETLFAMKEGREGELGCRARILQAKLVSQSGKQQQAVNILRQATKSHGSKWILISALANMYLQLNQEEAYIKTLELLLQCLLTVESNVVKFEERILQILHQDQTPSVSETLYNMVNIHIKLKRFDVASERMLQLLARQDDAMMAENMSLSLRSLVRETAFVLLEAGKLQEARIVCNRAVTSPMHSQSDKASSWLDKLAQDVTALLLLVCIHGADQKWDEVLQAIDCCVRELRSVTPTATSDTELQSQLVSRCLLQSAEVYQTKKDHANTKHAYFKALHANKDREVLLLFVRYLLGAGENAEALKLWFAQEKNCPNCDVTVNSDRVLSYLLAPKLSDVQKLNIEKEIKLLIIKSRK